jgi:hypothetical protein
MPLMQVRAFTSGVGKFTGRDMEGNSKYILNGIGLLSKSK